VHPSVDECRIEIESATSDGRFRVTFVTGDGRYENVLMELRGRHQIVNVSVAIRLAEVLRRRGFEIPTASMVKGIATARHEGRLELVEGQPSLLLDGAHNPSGAQALREFLREFVHVPITLVFGAMKDKKLREIAAILFPTAERLILTEPDNPRAASITDLHCLAETIVDQKNILAAPSVRQALCRAKEVTPSGGLICVTGSLYLVGEVKALLKELTLSKVAH
jgi:dihydrofolate synthase/folylpolyglutamate synthase